MTEQHLDPTDGEWAQTDGGLYFPAPEQEFDLFALRSFKFCVERPTSRRLLDSVGVWSDGKCRVWRSIAYTNVGGWEDGTCEAVCQRGRVLPRRHDPPDDRCGCGIYGSLSYADLLRQYHAEARTMVAVIAAEGTTIIGTRGLSTQYARVVAYWCDPDPIRRDCAATQFKDAQVYDCPDDMITAYGLQLLPPASSSRRSGDTHYWTEK
jgi:hypothetical protein